MRNPKSKILNPKSGFTIIETLVAISILVIAIVGTSTAVQGAISSYTHSKDQIIAFYLAQEGFEQIRNLRDENRLKNRNWLTGIAENSSDACYFPDAGGGPCAADAITTALTRCPGAGSCPILRQDPATGFYGYNASWNETPFRREITLTSIEAGKEIMVTVTVSWSKGIVSRQFKAKELLLNW